MEATPSYERLEQEVSITQLPVSSPTDDKNGYLYEDIPFALRRKLTATALASIVIAVLLIVLENIGNSYIALFTVYSGVSIGILSIYSAILFLVLSRQQVYALNSLLVAGICQLVYLSLVVILICLIFATSITFKSGCESYSEFGLDSYKKCRRARVFAIAIVLVMILLHMPMTVFNLVIIVRGRRKGAALAISNSTNQHLVANISLWLEGKLKAAGMYFILAGLLWIGLDVGIILNGSYSIRFTGITSGVFSLIFGTVLLLLHRRHVVVLTSVFSLALWFLVILILAFIQHGRSFYYLTCVTNEPPYDIVCARGRILAIISFIVIVISTAVTIYTIILSVIERRRGKQQLTLFASSEQLV